jgi:EmrB/QacA subfamily drug resistance transporter
MSRAVEQPAVTSGSHAVAKPGLVIATMCSAVVLVIAAVASLSIAVPSIGKDLQASQSDLQWIVKAFAVTLSALLLPMGALGDRFGRKRVMVIGFAVFVAGSVWAAMAGSIGALIAARALGGVGAGMVFPGTLSTLTSSMPPERRGLAIGLWTASASLGGTLGTVAAGALIERFWFGSVFVALAAAAAIVGIATAAVVPETSDPDHAHLDPVGSLLSIAGIGGLAFALAKGPVSGWTNALVLTGFAVAIVGVGGFARWELATVRPLLDVRLFKLRWFSLGAFAVFVQFVVVFGYFFVAAQYLGFVSGYGPFQIAAALLPVGLLLPFLSANAPKWASRFGRARVCAGGLALMALGSATFATIDATTSYWVFAVALVVFGAGMGLAGPPATEAIVDALPSAKQGVASATNDVARELGGTLGIALLGAALNTGYRATVGDRAGELPPGTVDVVRDSAAAGLAVAEQAGAGAPGIVGLVQDALVSGFTTAMAISAALLAGGAVLVLGLGRRTAAAA